MKKIFALLCESAPRLSILFWIRAFFGMCALRAARVPPAGWRENLWDDAEACARKSLPKRYFLHRQFWRLFAADFLVLRQKFYYGCAARLRRFRENKVLLAQEKKAYPILSFAVPFFRLIFKMFWPIVIVSGGLSAARPRYSFAQYGTEPRTCRTPFLAFVYLFSFQFV